MKFIAYIYLSIISLVISATVIGFFHYIVLSENPKISQDPLNFISGFVFISAILINIFNWISLQKGQIWISRILFTAQSCAIAFFAGMTSFSNSTRITNSDLLVGFISSISMGFFAFLLSSFLVSKPSKAEQGAAANP